MLEALEASLLHVVQLILHDPTSITQSSYSLYSGLGQSQPIYDRETIAQMQWDPHAMTIPHQDKVSEKAVRL
jgi:hypothetical protein